MEVQRSAQTMIKAYFPDDNLDHKFRVVPIRYFDQCGSEAEEFVRRELEKEFPGVELKCQQINYGKRWTRAQLMIRRKQVLDRYRRDRPVTMI